MAMTKDISPGQSAKLTVTLKKGAYDIDCPIPGHKALGMNVNITVGGASTTSSRTTNSGTAAVAADEQRRAAEGRPSEPARGRVASPAGIAHLLGGRT